jgi:hypothetical protein
MRPRRGSRPCRSGSVPPSRFQEDRRDRAAARFAAFPVDPDAKGMADEGFIRPRQHPRHVRPRDDRRPQVAISAVVRSASYQLNAVRVGAIFTAHSPRNPGRIAWVYTRMCRPMCRASRDTLRSSYSRKGSREEFKMVHGGRRDRGDAVGRTGVHPIPLRRSLRNIDIRHTMPSEPIMKTSGRPTAVAVSGPAAVYPALRVDRPGQAEARGGGMWAAARWGLGGRGRTRGWCFFAGDP